jgi:hypothetical protein
VLERSPFALGHDPVASCVICRSARAAAPPAIATASTTRATRRITLPILTRCRNTGLS